MNKLLRFIPPVAAIASAIVYAAICLHSIEEIHYLKSFFPDRFTVEEALYASLIELIKIIILGILFLLVVSICLFLMRSKKSS